MSVAALIRAMAAAGAPPEAIAIAVDAIEQAEAQVQIRKDAARDKKRAQRAAAKGQSLDSPKTVPGQSGDNAGTVPPPPFLDKESFPQTPFKEINPSPGVCIAPAREGDFPEEIREAWNAMAERTGLSAVAKLNPSRIAKIRARSAEHGPDKFTEAIEAVERSAFCRGDSANGWRADFDFLLQPKSFTRLIEGSYDRAKPNPGTSRGGRGFDPGDDPYIAAYRQVSAG